jgi:hydroxyethylthiazole kinase-like uncharacterized protein yjeF
VPDRQAAILLDCAEMAEADRLTIASGIPSSALMEAAGAAVAAAITRRWRSVPVSVLCGPGGNGGDGFVVARHLVRAGWPVRVGFEGDPAALRGASGEHARAWLQIGCIEPFAPGLIEGAELIVDAMFGAGLSRPFEGPARDLLVTVHTRHIPIVAIDVPSGVSGDDGADLGAVPADLTVTFFRKKPGHLLQPGRVLCGETELADIGIQTSVLDRIAPKTWENTPDLWHDSFPSPAATGNKYGRGHVLIWGGWPMTGASRLAARAAARAGAGLVTIAVPEVALPVYAANLLSIMVVPIAGTLEAILQDKRLNALLIGPGAGHSEPIRAHALAMLATQRAIVLDADVFTMFRERPQDLFGAVKGPCVMTPHEGEFARLFDTTGHKLQRARNAAKRAGAVIVLKGADTVIAAPDGRAAINANATPNLATAGAGDVLAGLITGLLAQSMPAFEAACCGVWMHSEAGAQFGPGLIAEDLPDLLPAALRRLGGKEEGKARQRALPLDPARDRGPSTHSFKGS